MRRSFCICLTLPLCHYFATVNRVILEIEYWKEHFSLENISHSVLGLPFSSLSLSIDYLEKSAPFTTLQDETECPLGRKQEVEPTTVLLVMALVIVANLVLHD